MGRSKGVNNTIIFPKHGQILPFFDDFTSQLVPSDEVINVSDLYLEYAALVEIKTTDVESMKVAHNLVRFSRQFSTFASIQKLDKVTCPKQGYKVGFKKRRGDRNSGQHCKYTLRQEVLDYLKTNKDLRLYPVPANQVFICKKTGRGLVACVDIEEGALVCEYLAQELTEKDFEDRLVFYKHRDMLPTDVKVGKKIFDGYADQDGYAIDICDNTGTQLNHSKTERNCLMKMVEVWGVKKLFLFAKTTIPKGRELLWNYDDNRKGLEDWIYM